MDETKLTPWFDGRRFKPVRVGVYPVRPPKGSWWPSRYRHWNGKRWGPRETTPALALAISPWGACANDQKDDWRGLLKEGKP